MKKMITIASTLFGTSRNTCLLIITTLFVMSGCAQNAAYRSDFTPCTFNQQGDCIKNAIQHHAPGEENEYRLAFVEFDDKGLLRHREQMEAVFNDYYPVAAEDDIMMIVFIHGWHHNAMSGDSNIQEFRNLLEKIARIENASRDAKNHKSRKVLGLYVGWRGESVLVPLLNETTFWERKNTAHNVGLQGVTELLLKLEEIVNIKKGMETEPRPLNSRFVVIGHSFGGAVLYTSLQQVLADRFIDSRSDKTFSDDAKGFGDLVLLINPAFEAIRFATLYDMSQQGCRSYFPTQLPRMAILTSEKDYATKYLFPAGRIFSTFFESHTTLKRHQCTANGPKELTVKEGKADRTTVGHFEPFLTHKLEPSTTKLLRSSDFNYRQLQTAWSRQTHEGTLHFENTNLIHLGKTRPLNPYLNIKVNKKLIPDHNDIWGDSVVSFIRDLIVLSTLPEQ